MKYIKIGIMCVLGGLIIFACLNLFIIFAQGPANSTWIPESGVWYCEDLKMQLSFEDGYENYVFLDERKILCGCENDKGSKYITVLCQESGVEGYQLGDVFFSGQYIEHDDFRYVVEDINSGDIYTFIRISP